MPDALKRADEVLQQSVRGITDLINVPSLINLDFADVKTVMENKGIAHIGIGVAKGDDKAIEAVKQAVNSPLLETTIQGASHIIVNISGEITLLDADDAVSFVRDLTGDDVNLIMGAQCDDRDPDTCTVTVIATGIDESRIPKPDARPAAAGLASGGMRQFVSPNAGMGMAPNQNPAMTGNIGLNPGMGTQQLGGMTAPLNAGMGVPQNTMGMNGAPQFGTQNTAAPYNFQNTQMNMNPAMGQAGAMGQTGAMPGQAGAMQVQPIPGVTQNTAPTPEPTTFGGGLRGVSPLTSRVESRQIKIPDFLKK